MASIRKRTTPGKTAETWQVRWREDGRMKSKTFTNNAAAVRYRGRIDANGQRDPDKKARRRETLTLDEWATRSIQARTKASARTKADYQRDYNNHISDVLGNEWLHDITPEMCGNWFSGLDVAPKSAANYAGVLTGIFKTAVANGLIDANPMDDMTRPVATTRVEEMSFLTRTQFDTLLAAVDDWYRPFVHTLATTGLRWGEATALTVSDIDPISRQLTVSKAWKRNPTEKTYFIGEPKTQRSRRTITIDTDTRDILIPLLAGKRGTDLVFTKPNGKPIRSQAFGATVWVRAVARLVRCDTHYGEREDKHRLVSEPCGCPQMMTTRPRIHDLRHSHASWLIAAKVPLPAIQRRLGHSTIVTTIDRYGHLVSELDDEIDAAMTGRTSTARSTRAEHAAL